MVRRARSFDSGSRRMLQHGGHPPQHSDTRLVSESIPPPWPSAPPMLSRPSPATQPCLLLSRRVHKEHPSGDLQVELRAWRVIQVLLEASFTGLRASTSPLYWRASRAAVGATCALPRARARSLAPELRGVLAGRRWVAAAHRAAAECGRFRGCLGKSWAGQCQLDASNRAKPPSVRSSQSMPCPRGMLGGSYIVGCFW